MNSTDLHIEFKKETGKHFCYVKDDAHPPRYQRDTGYGWEYSEWLEKKYLELLNKQLNNNN